MRRRTLIEAPAGDTFVEASSTLALTTMTALPPPTPLVVLRGGGHAQLVPQPGCALR